MDPRNTRQTLPTLLMLLVAISAGALPLCSCLPTSANRTGSEWVSPYCDPDAFAWDSGRASYAIEDGSIVSKTGVDVSSHQGFIDWDAVAADDVEFAFIRVGYRGSSEGGLYQDEHFEYNLQQAQAAGIECGAYFFSQAVSEAEAQEEAEFVLQLLSGTQLDYPVAFDYEKNAADIQGRIGEMGPQEATAIARAFCETIEAAGYEAMLYGNAYDLANFNLDELYGYSLWFAEYSDYPSSRRPFTIWQYASDGHVAGIETNVDMNLDIRAQ